jgi:hypothetical protein
MNPYLPYSFVFVVATTQPKANRTTGPWLRILKVYQKKQDQGSNSFHIGMHAVYGPDTSL